MIFSTYAFRCPRCAKTYKKSVSPLFLGPGSRVCGMCGAGFSDGSAEWPQLTPQEQRLFLLPPTILGWLGGIAVCVIAAFQYARPDDSISLPGFAFVMLFVPTLGPCFLFRAYQVRQSSARYDKAMRSSLGMSVDGRP